MGPQVGMGDAASAEGGNRPGGGIGVPIGSPDPLSRYKWWILEGLAILLIAGAALLLKKRSDLIPGSSASQRDIAFEPAPLPTYERSAAPAAAFNTAPGASNAVLLNILKEELFAIESEKLSGTLSPDEYAKIKIGLEAVLKRALSKK
jgi:hypothetical protein